MQKRAYFDQFDKHEWPDPDWLEPYFLSPPEKRWFFESGNDGARLVAEGLYGTEGRPRESRVDSDLMMWANPALGVLLIYSKSGGGFRETYSSKGDLSRLQEWVRTLHDDPMPIGLFIPFDKAWLAVKEFIETEGELPKSIEWVANRDLPPNTFPDP
jgi:hypothetical protein